MASTVQVRFKERIRCDDLVAECMVTVHLYILTLRLCGLIKLHEIYLVSWTLDLTLVMNRTSGSQCEVMQCSVLGSSAAIRRT